jgi:hypothetical protein
VGGPSGVCLSAFEFGRAHRLRGRAHGRRLHGLRPLARHVRGGARLRRLLRARELRLLHALPRGHRAGGAAHGQAGRAAPARATTSTCCSSWTADARHHALRPGRHGLQPAARHHPTSSARPTSSACSRCTSTRLRPRRRTVHRAPHDRPRRRRQPTWTALSIGRRDALRTPSARRRRRALQPGDTVLQAATRAGRYIPHLCWHPDFAPHGSCRLCVVKAGRRTVAGLHHPGRARAMDVQSHTPELTAQRKTLLQMLFVEGNHFCPSCEKSGHCLLQATAYAAGMEGPHFEEFYPDRPVDASHPDLLLDFNRCILCGCACAPAANRRQGTCSPSAATASARTCWSTAQRPAGRQRHARRRPRRPHLPGGRDPAQAARLCGADRPAALRPTPIRPERPTTPMPPA